MGAKLDESLACLGVISSALMESKEEVTPPTPPTPQVASSVLDESAGCRTLLALSLAEERNATTFKKCTPGAMAGTAKLRHSIPGDKFAKKDEDNPTYPNRGSCRASGAGKLRMLQYNKTGGEVKKRVISDVTKNTPNMKAWGTGVGGQRMEKTASGELRRDHSKHTPPYSPSGGSKGPAGNREVVRARLAHAKPAHKKKAEASARSGGRTAYARSRAGA